jgi:phosphonate transport system permease protein
MIWFKKSHYTIIILLAGLVAGSMYLTGFDFTKFQDFRNMADFISKWFPMNTDNLPFLLEESLITISIAFLGSLFGLLAGLPLSFLAARNTSRFHTVLSRNKNSSKFSSFCP